MGTAHRSDAYPLGKPQTVRPIAATAGPAEGDRRPNLVPIYDAADRAMRDELGKWVIPVPEELRRALSRAVVGRLRDAAMLNYDRPWEADDRELPVEP